VFVFCFFLLSTIERDDFHLSFFFFFFLKKRVRFFFSFFTPFNNFNLTRCVQNDQRPKPGARPEFHCIFICISMILPLDMPSIRRAGASKLAGSTLFFFFFFYFFFFFFFSTQKKKKKKNKKEKNLEKKKKRATPLLVHIQIQSKSIQTSHVKKKHKHSSKHKKNKPK
jgi:cbb3-type cytochrome oxidase subunit 3